MCILYNIAGVTGVSLMKGIDRVHDGRCFYILWFVVSQILQEITLQVCFVLSMLMQVISKEVVVAIGKGVCRIMYEFSHCVIVY